MNISMEGMTLGATSDKLWKALNMCSRCLELLDCCHLTTCFGKVALCRSCLEEMVKTL